MMVLSPISVLLKLAKPTLMNFGVSYNQKLPLSMKPCPIPVMMKARVVISTATTNIIVTYFYPSPDNNTLPT